MHIRRRKRMYEIRKKYLPKRRRTFARIYGRFETMTGKYKGFEFQVRVSSNLTGKTLYHKIRNVVGKIKHDHLMPYHKRRETFPTFRSLMSVPWVRIRRVLDYDVKVDYDVPFGRRIM